MQNRERETSDHFLVCTSYCGKLHEGQKKYITTCNKYTVDSYLRYLIHRIVRGESFTEGHIQADNPLFPLHDYKTLLSQQKEIGWHNFMRGYASLAWDQHQQRYLHQIKQVPRNTVTWLANIILDIQEYVYQRWLFRNECLHLER